MANLAQHGAMTLMFLHHFLNASMGAIDDVTRRVAENGCKKNQIIKIYDAIIVT